MKAYIKVNKDAYNSLADEYLKRLGNKSVYEAPLAILVGKPVKYAQTRFGKKLLALDIGPGRGESVMYMQKKGCVVDTLDVADRILDLIQNISPGTNTIKTDILEYTIPPEHYHLIYCGALIHLFKLPDARKIMKNIHRGLMSKGILFINTTIHAKSSEGYYIKDDYRGQIRRYRHKYTEQEFRDLITQNGFNVLDEIRTDEKDRNKMWHGYICEKVS